MKGKIKIIMIILASTLLLTITAGYLWRGGVMAPCVPADKLTISTSLSTVTGMLLIAQEKGYFLKNALEVTLRFLPSGNVGLEQLKTGETDFACSTEFALVSGIFGEGQSLRCLGAVAAAEDAQVIARKGGISQPGDLKGKKVGLFRGSNAEFFLGRFLTLHGLSTGDVEPVNLDPFAMAAALREGRVDAVMIWEPTAFAITSQLGDRVVGWPGQGGQKYYWLLVSTDEFLRARPTVTERLFRALNQAERHISKHRDESIAIVAAKVNINPDILKNIWAKYAFELSFDQSLVIAMEDQARWMIKNKLTGQTKVPDYLEYFSVEALGQVDPKAVKIIIPKGGKMAVPDEKR